MQRTYSRKRAQRRTYTSGGAQDEPLSPDLGRARKRHKIEVEVVSPQNSSDNNAHETGIEGDLRYGSENRNRSTPSTHKPPARLRTPTTPVQESPPPVSSRKTLARSATTSLVADEDQTTSPRRRARDLSDIFSFASSTTIPGSSHGVVKPHGGVARRMLSRARTESSVISISSFSEQEYNSIHGTPKKLRAFASDSIVGTPSSHSPSYPPLEAKPSDDVSSPPVRPVLGNPNNIRTYAGKSRSFLVALPPSQAASLGMDPVLSGDPSAMFGENHEDDFEIRESYSELRQRWGVDASEDDPRPVSPQLSPSPKRKGKGKGLPKEDPVRLLPNGMMNDLKSITELRSKGESRRFLDEVGYLFEGLDAQGALSVRRGSALEIVSKLCDVDFARRAKAADFLGRAWEVLREAGAGDGDRVLDSVLTFYAALVARDPTDLSDLSTKHDFAGTLHRMLASLEHHNDPLWLISCRAEVGELRAAGISKAETATLDNLHRLVRKKSGIFGECDIISNRLLISSALTVVTPSTHTLSHLSPLLRSLTSEINFLPSRVSAYASGLSLFPPHGSSSHVNTPSLLYLENCLRLLDSCLLGSWSISEEGLVIQAESLEKLREDGFPTALLALCVSCCIIFQDSALEEHRAIASRCVESALRVLINLTHDDLTWCRAVLDDEHSIPTIMRLIVMAQCERRILEKRADVDEADSEPDDNAARCLDRLCLALGLLTNLVQATPDARQRVGETLLDFNCPGQRRCLRECTCPSRTSSLVCLAQVYTDYYKSSNELDAVVRGHMAVLFGLLMQHAAANQRALLAALPGVDDRAKLGVLLQHAQDFTLFYVALTRKMAEAQDRDHDDDDDEVEDSGHAASAVFRDSKGEAVAKGVIDFLKTLRTEGGR